MNAISTVTAAALLAAAGATVAVAQTQTQTPSDPSTASSPHQRQATHSDASEQGATNGADPSAASTPHQHDAMKGDRAMTAGATPETFVKTAAQDGMAEVGLAKLALKKSSNNDVKQFAQKMEQDHEQADDQLASIAKSKGLTLPKKLDTKHEALLKSLSAKSGAAFDGAYAEHMAKAHEQAVALFEGAAKSSDVDLATFAKQTLPTLEEHKQLADNLVKSVGTRTASAVEGGKGTSQQ